MKPPAAGRRGAALLAVSLPFLGEVPLATQEPPKPFVRGDANAGGGIDLADAVFILSFLFLKEDPPPCPDAADVDDTGVLEITDAIYLLDWLFGTCSDPRCPAPKEPSPPGVFYLAKDCGNDPTPDGLSCPSFKPCPICPKELPPEGREERFVRGDVYGDSSVELTDSILILNWLLLGAVAPLCFDAADTNDDGCIDLQDAMMFPLPGVCPFPELEFCEPRPPYRECGTDPTPDFLGCEVPCS